MKSPISRKMKLVNKVKEVRYLNDFSNDTAIEFLENDSGEIILTPVYLNDFTIYITDHNDNFIDDVDTDEIYLALITED